MLGGVGQFWGSLDVALAPSLQNLQTRLGFTAALDLHGGRGGGCMRGWVDMRLQWSRRRVPRFAYTHSQHGGRRGGKVNREMKQGQLYNVAGI